MTRDLSRMDAVRELVRREGLIQARDLHALGAPRAYLARLVAEGTLVRVGRGTYASATLEPSQHHTLAVVARQVPQAVFTLLTALRFHEIGSESPWQVWVALPRGHWRPKLEGVTVEPTWLDPAELPVDVETHLVAGAALKVFSAARAVVECFRFRSKIGLEPCLEALREHLRRNPGGVDGLWAIATRRRVAGVLRPYLEALS